VLLGAIIEKVTGLSYADFVQTHIFEPLGMIHSCYDQTERIIPGRVAGYTTGSDGPINAAYLSMTHPQAAGGLLSCVDDLARWDVGLAADRLIKKETLELAYRPFVLKDGESTGYGFGWAISEYEGLRFLEHGGGIHGFTCGTVRVPSERIYVAVLTNNEAPKTDPNLLAFKLAGLAAGHPVVAPTPIEIPEASLEAYVGVYQINEKEVRIITRQGVQLNSQRSGGMRQEITAYASDAFYFKDSLDRLHFLRNAEGLVTGMRLVRRYGPPEYAPKTDQPAPQERQAIPLPSEALARLCGLFELAPGFNLNIILEEGQLWVQPTGQEKLRLYPETPERLFAREVDVTLDYQFDDAGRLQSCTFQQGPETMPLKKVK